MEGARPTRLVIHAGLQKTGSTAIHHYLARNRDLLAGHLSVLSPVRGSATRALGRSAVAYSLDPVPARRADLAQAARAVAKEAAALGGTVLISHENMLGAMPGNGGTVTLYPEMEAILSTIDAAFGSLRPDFAVCTREMASWKRSVYNQAVRSDRYAAPFETFLEDTVSIRDWADMAQRMTEVIGAERLHLMAVEDEPDRTRPGDRLLRLAGVPSGVLEQLSAVQGARNPSLPDGAVELLRLINGLELEREQYGRLADLIAENQFLFVSGRPAGQAGARAQTKNRPDKPALSEEASTWSS